MAELNKFKSELSFGNKVLRALWGAVWLLLFRPSPRLCHQWRRFLLRLFGAKIDKTVRIDSSAEVFYPPNLTLLEYVVIGPRVDLYCVAPITICKNAMVSQYSYLCSASHDYTQSHLPLIASPIVIGTGTWVCAKAFVGPGVTIGNNSLVAAGSVVVRDVADNQIVGGNPAKFLKNRPAT
ncbi:putative colanic acid biosynthesis acetyltransferase [bacterium]|nr:putative colanic acid biosynthesis acetyltransferase [bacterium]